MTSLSPQAEEEAEIEMSASRSFPPPLRPLAPPHVDANSTRFHSYHPPPPPHVDANSTRFQSYHPPPPPPAVDPLLADRGKFAPVLAQRFKDDAQKLSATEHAGGKYYSLNFSSASAAVASASALSFSEQEQRRQQAVFQHQQMIRHQQLASHSTALHNTSLYDPIYLPLCGHANNISLNPATMNRASTPSSQSSLREHQLRIQGIAASSHTFPRYDLPPQGGLGLPHSHVNQRLLSPGVPFKMTGEGVSSAAPSHQSNNQALIFFDETRIYRLPHNTNNAYMDQFFSAATLAEMRRHSTLPSSMPQNLHRAMMDNRIGAESASAGMITSPSTKYPHFLNVSLTKHNRHVHDGSITESALKPVHLPVATEENRNGSLNNIFSSSKIDGGLVQTRPTKMIGQELLSSGPYAVIGGTVKKNPMKAREKKEIESSSSDPNTLVERLQIDVVETRRTVNHAGDSVHNAVFGAGEEYIDNGVAISDAISSILPPVKLTHSTAPRSSKGTSSVQVKNQTEVQNSAMGRKHAEPINTDGQNKVVDKDGEKISKKNATEMAGAKNEGRIVNIETVKKKMRINAKTEKIRVHAKNLKNSKVWQPPLTHIPPNPPLLPSQEVIPAQTNRLNVGRVMTLNISLSPPLAFSEKIISANMSQSKEQLVTAQMNQTVVRDTAISHIPPNPTLLPPQEVMPTQANQLNFETMMTLNIPSGPLLTSSEQIVSANRSSSDPNTLVERLQIDVVETRRTVNHTGDSVHNAVFGAGDEYIDNGVAISDAISSVRPPAKLTHSTAPRSSKGTSSVQVKNQTEAQNSSMGRKHAEPINTDGQNKVVDKDGEKISKKNATEMAGAKNKRRIVNIETVKKKMRINAKTEKIRVHAKNLTNSKVWQPLISHIPPNPPLLPSQEVIPAQTNRLNVGRVMTLNISLSPPLAFSEKIISANMSQSKEQLVTAQMNQTVVRDTAISHIPPNPTLLPPQEVMPTQANQLNFGTMMTLNIPSGPLLTSSEQIVSANRSQSKPITYHCPKCVKDFRFTEPQTAAASFSNHVRKCGREKKKEGSGENGMRERAKKEKRHQQQRKIRERNMINSTPSETGFVVKGGKCALRIESTLSSLKIDGGTVRNKFTKTKNKKKSSSDAKAAKGPKSFRSSYIFFASCIRPTISKEHVAKQGVAMGEQWRAMTTEEKEPYVKMAIRDKERYFREKAAFVEKGTKPSDLKSGQTEGTDGDRACPSLEKDKGTLSRLCREVTTSKFINAQTSYPYAPMGQLWLVKSLTEATAGRSNLDSGSTLIGRRWVWDEGHFVDGHFDPHTRKNGRSGCTCGSNHLLTILNTIQNPKPSHDAKSPGRARRSERSAYSSSVTAQLADGQLDPHTLIACEEYDLGPEYRFVKDPHTEKVQPFSVRVNPDATFLADLHAHLCDSEIIGLLGGYYSKEEKCIYIQAAFPCKATDRTDSGYTDVEMDPVFQIYASEAIANHGMTAVGWYHSHPDFQPNPSITDIENQANYQQLFQGGDLAGRNAEVSPFVGLIVGTYDGKNPESQSVMRWFHVRPRETAECKSVNFPMNLKTTDRHYRKMSFDNQNIADNIRQSMTLHSSNIRQVLESRYLSCPASELPDSQMKLVERVCINQHSANFREHKGSIGNDDDVESGISKESYAMRMPVGHKQNDTGVLCSLSLLETGESSLLLSEALFNQRSEIDPMRQFQSACPLYFTDNERSILDIGHNAVPCDVFAGIIWFAVEREQLPKSDSNEHSLISPCIPASSRSILDLLLRQSLNSSNMLDKKLYDIIHCLDDVGLVQQTVQLDDNDAAILHSLYVVLGHYAPKLNRINPFSSWSGAGDKGNIIKGYGSCSDPWVDFYLTTILKVEVLETDEGRVYRGGIKMKRGHKITACLLRWARNMQLSVKNEFDKRDRFPINDSHDGGLTFDHEQKLNELKETAVGMVPHHQRYIYFVTEVMRLMAARWRECGVRPQRNEVGPP